jgi:hypothetical protein
MEDVELVEFVPREPEESWSVAVSRVSPEHPNLES